jgi:hypothetical protein
VDFSNSSNNNATRTHLRILATCFARVANSFALKKERAQGRPGARCTRGLACKGYSKKPHTSIQVQRKQSGLPCAMVLRLIFVLSPVRPRLACHRHSQKARASREFNTCHRGVRTTRLCRTLHAPFVKSASTSIAPRPNVSDDGQRPLSRDGMSEISS